MRAFSHTPKNPLHRGCSASGQRTQSGLALIESLIAMGVLAIGVLALLAVQLRLLSEARTSVGRSQAIHLIDDFAERVAANKSAWQAGSAVTTNGLLNLGVAIPANPLNDCRIASCTADELAAFDLWTFKRNAQQLPGGDAAVVLPANNANLDAAQIAVTVAWSRNEQSNALDLINLLSSTLDSGTTGVVNCPAGSLCHLSYIAF